VEWGVGERGAGSGGDRIVGEGAAIRGDELPTVRVPACVSLSRFRASRARQNGSGSRFLCSGSTAEQLGESFFVLREHGRTARGVVFCAPGARQNGSGSCLFVLWRGRGTPAEAFFRSRWGGVRLRWRFFGALLALRVSQCTRRRALSRRGAATLGRGCRRRTAGWAWAL
jgi:hypothetical protein